MVKTMMDHQLHVMTLLGSKVIVAIGSPIDNPFHLEYYQPTSDQWSTFTPPDLTPGLHDRHHLKGETLMLVKENTVFLVNMLDSTEVNEVDDKQDGCEVGKKRVSMKWEFSKDSRHVSIDTFPELPIDRDPVESDRNMFGAMLAISK